jgi:hypothetical protein
METYTLTNDIEVFYVKAKSFPEGIGEAHERMHALLPSLVGRKLFGISHPDQSGQIIYMAGVEAHYKNEGKEFGCDTFVIKRGAYTSEIVKNYNTQLARIAKIFETMIAEPAIDGEGACVEEYISENELRCMVRLA